MSSKMERTERRQGEAHAGNRRVETPTATTESVNSGKALQMESVVERGNLLEALVFRELDEWIRHRLRQLHLKQWKRSKTIYRELLARRVPEWIARKIAANSRRWWHNSCMALNNALPIKYFDELGLPRLGKGKVA